MVVGWANVNFESIGLSYTFISADPNGVRIIDTRVLASKEAKYSLYCPLTLHLSGVLTHAPIPRSPDGPHPSSFRMHEKHAHGRSRNAGCQRGCRPSRQGQGARVYMALRHFVMHFCALYCSTRTLALDFTLVYSTLTRGGMCIRTFWRNNRKGRSH
eukprot:1188401-Prorocentrum_minimum.AAC.7